MSSDQNLFSLLVAFKKQKFSTLYTFNQLKMTWMGLILGTFLMACETPFPSPLEDEKAPELMIYSPLEGVNYTVDDSIIVDIDIAENDQLHFVSIQLINEQYDTLYWDYYMHDHSRSLSIHEYIKLEPIQTKKYLMLIEADDHNGNRTNSITSFIIRI